MMEPGKPVSIRHCAIYTPKSSETLCFFDGGELGRRRKYADRCKATRMKIRIPPVLTENSERMGKSGDLSCPALVSRACSHPSQSLFHGWLVGFAAARN